jgi:hypothetical protein
MESKIYLGRLNGVQDLSWTSISIARASIRVVSSKAEALDSMGSSKANVQS